MPSEATRTLFETDAHNPAFASVSALLDGSGKPLDFCVPVNRHFPPAELMEDIRENLHDIVKYYPEYAETHQQCISSLTGVPASRIVVANGSTELITLLCREAQAPMASCVPTFGQWTDLPGRSGVALHLLQRDPANRHELYVEDIISQVRSQGVRTLVLCNPNNPTGAVIAADGIRQLLHELQDLSTIVLDESFIDYSTESSAEHLVTRWQNLVVVKSLGKSLGWHGLRLGYAVAHEERAATLRNSLPCWNINGLAAFVLQRISGMGAELAASFARTRQDRQEFERQLSGIDKLTMYPSAANFLFARLQPGVSGKWLRDRLLEEHGCFIRECSNKVGSSEQYLRLAVNLPAENLRLVNAMKTLLPPE